FTQEDWFRQHLSFLSLGKIRGSYGITGSDGVFDYEYLTRWSASGITPYQGIPGYLPLQHANPQLHWESNRKTEIAFTFGLLKDRLVLDAAWYRNVCGDQLVDYGLPIITGFSSVYANSPATIQNTGLEGVFTAKLVETRDMEVSVNFNIGIN